MRPNTNTTFILLSVRFLLYCIYNMYRKYDSNKKFLKIFHKRKLYLNDFICVKIITNFIRCKNTTTTNNNNDMSIFDDK